MKVKRWNWGKREYEDYEVPDSRDIATIRFDMDTFVDCISCGKELPYGLTYTSMEFHTDMGMGYCVCEECFEKEWQRRYYAEKMGANYE